MALLEQFLIDAHAIPENDERPPSRRTFNAEQYAGLLAEIPTLVTPLRMRSAIGATEAQLKSLAADGVLSPRTTRQNVKQPWRLSDGLALVKELDLLAIRIPRDHEGWEGTQYANLRTGLGVGNIIAAVRKRELRVGRQEGVFGYRSFMVNKSEVDQRAGAQPHVRQRAKSVPAGEPAWAFAYSVGLKKRGVFPALFEAGHVSACWVQHPLTRADVLYVTEADKEAFVSRFLTPTLMRKEFGISSQNCNAKLKAAGLKPFAPEGKDYGPLYERKDAERLLAAF